MKSAEKKDLRGHDRISPTAWIVCFRRTLTDIPYSQTIFDEFERMRQELGEPSVPENLRAPELAPQIEARYKLINQLLKLSGIEQVLEIAAGLSPRGLEISDDPRFTYVELDLPEVASQKKRIVTSIGERTNLYVESGNALDLESLKAAASPLNLAKPIAIINEGLLRYMNFSEKVQVARNVHSLLEQFGGVWITSDITIKHILQKEDSIARQQVRKVNELTGINVDENRFENVEEGRKFFEDLGFSIEQHSFMEALDNLVSPQRIKQPRQETEESIEDAVVFVMRLSSKK